MSPCKLGQEAELRSESIPLIRCLPLVPWGFEGFGFRVLGFRALGFRVQGLGFRVLGCRVLGFRVLGLRVLGFRVHVDAGFGCGLLGGTVWSLVVMYESGYESTA